MLRRLRDTFGDNVVEGVDEEAVIQMADLPKAADPASAQHHQQQQPAAEAWKTPAKQPSQSFTKSQISRSLSAASAEKKKRSLFGFRRSRKSDESSHKQSNASFSDIPLEPQRITVFGVPLDSLPRAAMCATSVGDQSHILPLVVYKHVEDMYRRGLQSTALFRVLGDLPRTDVVQRQFETPPHFGDQVNLEEEATETVTELFKRYLRELPDPVFDSRLWPLFRNACILSNAPLDKRVGAAQSILRLIPKRNFSLFIYLIAFFINLSQVDDSGLTNRDLGDIFGASLLAPRTARRSMSNNNHHRTPHTGYHGIHHAAAQEAKQGLEWLLSSWGYICGAPIPMGPVHEDASPPATEAIDMPGEKASLSSKSRQRTSYSRSSYPRSVRASIQPQDAESARPVLHAPDSSYADQDEEGLPDEEEDDDDEDEEPPLEENTARESPVDHLPGTFVSRSMSYHHPPSLSTQRRSDSIEELEHQELTPEEIRFDDEYLNERQQPTEHQDTPATMLPLARIPSPMPDFNTLARLSYLSLSPDQDMERTQSQYSESTVRSLNHYQQYSQAHARSHQPTASRSSYASARDQTASEGSSDFDQESYRGQSVYGQQERLAATGVAAPVSDWYEGRPPSQPVSISSVEGDYGPLRSQPSLSSIKQVQEGSQPTGTVATQRMVERTREEPEALPFDGRSTIRRSQDSSAHGPELMSDLRDQVHRLKVLVATQDAHHKQERDQMNLHSERLQRELDSLLAARQSHEDQSRHLSSNLDHTRQSHQNLQKALESAQLDLQNGRFEQDLLRDQVNELTRRLERADKDRESKTKDVDRLLRILANTAKERDMYGRKIRKVRKVVTSVDSVESIKSLVRASSEEAALRRKP